MTQRVMQTNGQAANAQVNAGHTARCWSDSKHMTLYRECRMWENLLNVFDLVLSLLYEYCFKKDNLDRNIIALKF